MSKAAQLVRARLLIAAVVFGALSVPSSAFALAAPPPSGLTRVSRLEIRLDDGKSVTVDNGSPFSPERVQALVVMADRSTQCDCPSSQGKPHKGLFKTGDRLFISDHYLAWFDYTKGDGKRFGPAYSNAWGRAGALTGWWSLDAATRNFRCRKTGPNGCKDWAPNQLIPGSASPNQEESWWDAYAPPLEHTMVVRPGPGPEFYLLSYHYALDTKESQWAVVRDGTFDAAGAHYQTRARMTSWKTNVDVTDGNDANGVANWVDAGIEYVCRRADIVVTWKFRPARADVTVDNIYMYFWTAYAMDIDGTPCDVNPVGKQWPAKTYSKPVYTQSSMKLGRNFEPGGIFDPGAIVELLPGKPCCNPHVNNDVYTIPENAVGDGTWLRVGESPKLSSDQPRFEMAQRGTPNTGAGTEADPILFAWRDMINWQETHDGTYGFGLTRGPFTRRADFVTLRAGVWYQATFTLGSDWK